MKNSSGAAPQWLHRYALFTALMTVVLLAAGALVTGTGSGLAVPDWPLSYGTLFPRMVGGVLYEHGHRLIAGFVALLTVGLAALLHFYEPRRAVRRLGYLAVGIVLFQATLGGLTVLLKLPKPVSVSHACLAQIFFCTVCSITLLTSSFWNRPAKALESPTLRAWSLLLVVTFFFQLVLGATVRHLGAGLAIPDFPTAFGGFLPPSFTTEIAVHFAHRMGALSVGVLTIGITMWIYANYGHHHDLVAFAGVLLATVSFQIMLGATVIWAKRPIPITTAHLVVGALCFASSVLLALGVYRHPVEERQTVLGPALRGELA